jgi:hypothetical protein
LQNWMRNSLLFGGKVVVFMGDFQQLLPVVRHGAGHRYTLMSADWWCHVSIMHFTQSFRSNDSDYVHILNQVGVGALPSVTVPTSSVEYDLDAFCCRVFGTDNEWHRHVVSLTLDGAAFINSHVIAQLPGAAEIAVAADIHVGCKDPDLYTDEFVHSLNIHGSPPALLELKCGARYMIMRNLDQSRRLVNGTEVILKSMRASSLTVETQDGQMAVIPRINFVISPDDSGLPFVIHRRQFPLIPAYALTVHRVQGQSLKFMGLYLQGEVFCHGLLFTMLSRVAGWDKICVYLTAGDDCVVKNLVRRDIVAHLL